MADTKAEFEYVIEETLFAFLLNEIITHVEQSYEIENVKIIFPKKLTGSTSLSASTKSSSALLDV